MTEFKIEQIHAFIAISKERTSECLGQLTSIEARIPIGWTRIRSSVRPPQCASIATNSRRKLNVDEFATSGASIKRNAHLTIVTKAMGSTGKNEWLEATICFLILWAQVKLDISKVQRSEFQIDTDYLENISRVKFMLPHKLCLCTLIAIESYLSCVICSSNDWMSKNGIQFKLPTTWRISTSSAIGEINVLWNISAPYSLRVPKSTIPPIGRLLVCWQHPQCMSRQWICHEPMAMDVWNAEKEK